MSVRPVDDVGGSPPPGGSAEARARRLEGEIAEVCGLLHATTARLVELIRQVVATGAWAGAGIRSAEQWVAWQCGVSPRRARALVAMASRLPELPVTAAAFGAGQLSEDQVRVVCGHAETHNDAEVAELARHATVNQLQRTLRDHRPAPDPDPVDSDGQPPPPEPRRVTFGFSEEGDRWTMTVRAPVDEGALIERALEEARQHLFAESADRSERSGIDWLDALLLVAERSLDHAAAVRPRQHRYLTLVHLRDDHLGRPAGHLHGGPALPDSLRRYLGCDGRVRAVQEVDGVPVSVGRTSRIVPDRTRMVIEDRDRGCRVPGCHRRRWLQVHHLRHWEEGGGTDSGNLVALCSRHHRQHHRGELGITGDPDRSDGLRFTDHRGRSLAPIAPPTPPTGSMETVATRLGVTGSAYVHPSGERLEHKWVSFSDP